MWSKEGFSCVLIGSLQPVAFLCGICSQEISHTGIESSWILSGEPYSNLYAAPNPLKQTQTHALVLYRAATCQPSDQKIHFILYSSLFGRATLVLRLWDGSKKKKKRHFCREEENDNMNSLSSGALSSCERHIRNSSSFDIVKISKTTNSQRYLPHHVHFTIFNIQA